MPASCHSPTVFRVIRLAVTAMLWAAMSQPALTQEPMVKAYFAHLNRDPISVKVLTGQSCLIAFDQEIGRLTVSNNDIVEAVVVAPDQIVINGKIPGRARFVTWSKEGSQILFFDIDVRANLDQIDTQVRALFPKEDIKLSQANGSVVLSGNVTSSRIAAQIDNVVQSAGFKTVNLLDQPVTNAQQVQLQIRVAEVSRNKLTELAASPAVQNRPGRGGYTNTGLGPWTLNQVDGGSIFGSVASTLNVFVMSNDVFLFLRALQNQGALRALAEPNLVAMDGKKATFLAGGEFPIPVVQGGNQGQTVTIEYKQYGVRLTFQPTIIDENHIRLELEPEVSTIDYNNAVRFSGFLIPGLRVRRAGTSIELQDGQSFGIAGLLDNNEIKTLSKIPVLGDIPVIGNIFKSKSLQRNETELFFIVTAKISKPLNPDSVPRMRNVEELREGSPLGIEQPVEKPREKTNSDAVSSPVEGTPPNQAEGQSEAGSKSNYTDHFPAPKPQSEAPASRLKTKQGVLNPKTSSAIKALAWKIKVPEFSTFTALRSPEK